MQVDFINNSINKQQNIHNIILVLDLVKNDINTLPSFKTSRV